MTERTDRFLTDAVAKGDQAAAQGGIDVNVPKNEPSPQAFVSRLLKRLWMLICLKALRLYLVLLLTAEARRL